MNLVSESSESGRSSSADTQLLSSLSDADLLDAWCHDRHAAALAVLVDRYSVMVLSVCRRRCRSADDADDAFQSTFLYLARNGHKIRRPERLVGWLHRVAQRAALATLKSSKRETQPMVEPPAHPDDPLARLAQRHEAIVLDEELADLPEHYRSAIVMHLYEGYPLQRLAEHFGTTVGSVRGRLQRGKQLLAQRLRRRGVVPVLAIAAAGAWTVSSSQAVQAGETFAQATADGNLPDPPIDTSLLESLLAQGVRLMPHLYTAAGLLGGTALVAFMVTAGPPRSEATQLSFSSGPAPMVAQFGGTNGNANQLAANTAGTKPDNTAVVETADLAGGQVPGQPSAATQQLEWADRLASVEPTSAIAKEVARLLDRNIDLDLTTTLDRLPDVLGAAAEIPVIIDERGVDFAGVESDKAPIIFSQQNVPLRTALRRMLRPLGLRAVIEEEGLVITADPTVLVHQGIGTSQWINIDDEAERRIASELDSETEFQFVDLALTDVVDYIAELHQLTMRIDRPSLEDIGLMVDEPITLELKGVKLRTALSCLLSDLDLTYTVVGESLVVTTVEAAEEHLATRIYWLEGTGFAVGDDNRDFQSIIDLIQTSIEPDTWEALGGPSTMAPVNSTRPALMISTTYTVHENIEQMFQTLRETQFGNDPVLQRIQVPARPKAGGGLGGGGFF